MDIFKVGLAGIGRHGKRYLSHIENDIKEMEIKAISRGSKKGLPEDIKGVALVENLSDEDLDLVIVCTPTNTHEQLAIDCLEKDLNILVEKPLSGDLESCGRIIEAEKNSEGSLMVAHTLRYTPVLKHMKEKLRGIDNIRWFEMVQSLEPPKTPWLLEERAMGGCVLNTGVHVFDTINWVLGDITHVSCDMERTFNPVWEDYAYGNATIKNGIEGSFKISRNTSGRSRYLRVDLEDGFLWADSLTSEFYSVQNGEMKKEVIKGETKALIPLLNDVVDVLKKEKEIPITSIDGTKAVSAAMSCYISDKRKMETRLKSYH